MRRLEAPAVKIARGRGSPVTARTALPPRKRPQPAWLRWAIRFGIGFGAMAAIGGGALWGVQSGWLEREWAVVSDVALNATADLGLSLQTVEVHGRGETKQKDIVGALGAPRGAPRRGRDKDAKREPQAARPRIVSAAVERR